MDDSISKLNIDFVISKKLTFEIMSDNQKRKVHDL